VTKPSVNLNGTSRGELLTQTGDAVDALSKALEALYASNPHGRDYLPQGGPDYVRARAEHAVRIRKVDAVYEEMLVIHLSLVEGQEGR